MNRGFYIRLAASNIKKNKRTYIPYILTCIITVTMYYIIKALSLNEGIAEIEGADSIGAVLEFGSQVTAVFASIFLFYTNSFLMKQRKKEFGVFNILGMEKRHIARVLALETLYIAIISLVAGFILGVALDKVMHLLIIKMLGGEVTLGFYISREAIRAALILFAIIFGCVFINSVRQVHLAKPVELLQGGNLGEKEPKTKWLMAILGLVCLGSGYYMALTVKNPVAALAEFFIAVLLVIAGTYMLFIAGSIVLLKLLRSNKKYYYQIKHFTSVSGMIYRMKQNAVGLGNICILSTMVLVMISSTSSLIIGVEDVMRTRYPKDICVYINELGEETGKKAVDSVQKFVEKSKVNTKDEMMYSYLSLSLIQDKEEFYVPEYKNETEALQDVDKLANLFIVTLDDYNRIFHKEETLNEDEVFIGLGRGKYDYDAMKIFDSPYQIKKETEDFVGNGNAMADVVGTIQVVVKDENVMDKIYQYQKKKYKEAASEKKILYGFNIKGNEDVQKEFYKDIRAFLLDNDYSGYAECKAIEYVGFMGVYGGMFFIGIFLGSLFIMATILIIYYKQISEGYDDKERFTIMQNVGMSHEEVKQSIHAQIMTVFFLPLIMAGIHVAAAFPMVEKILILLNLSNTKLYIGCTIGCFILFAVIYGIIYTLTARVYYQIVSREF